MVKSNVERAGMAQAAARSMEMLWTAAMLRAADAFTSEARAGHLKRAGEYARAGQAAALRAHTLLCEAF